MFENVGFETETGVAKGKEFWPRCVRNFEEFGFILVPLLLGINVCFQLRSKMTIL